ncbi:MAG: hypothetical protein M1823_005394 [Watsoniomyces obsoletus]|nr:MAG: hypothetical protein M1823_005394 [Watsoniomyces obsoletus]
MAAKKGLALKSVQSLLRLLQLLSAILILGIFSYFLATQARHDLFKPTWVKAVEGIAGAAVLWTLFALLLTFFVGGVTGFGALALVLDLLFFGAFIAVTILTRRGRRCTGFVDTPLGFGDVNGRNVFIVPENDDDPEDRNEPVTTYRPNLLRTCRLLKAVFAVAIILFILFLISALLQILLVRNHRKEKRYGPSPANNYTQGSGNRRRALPFFARKKANTRDAELAPVAATTADKHNHHHMRPSGETGYTGSTVAPGVDPVVGYNGGTNKTIHSGAPVTDSYGAAGYQNTTSTTYPGATQVRY